MDSPLLRTTQIPFPKPPSSITPVSSSFQAPLISSPPTTPRLSSIPISPTATSGLPINPSSPRTFNPLDFNRNFQQRISKLASSNNIETGYDDQSKYRGTVISGMRSGRGQYTYPNGDIYNGLWGNDKFQGMGFYTFGKQGQTYFGDFDNHLMHGIGTLVNTRTKQVLYEGGWNGGLRHGEGMQMYGNGEYYQGNWVNGIKQGNGIHVKDGNTYRGEFLNGKKHGRGEYKTRDGIIYQGVWNHQILDTAAIRYPQGDIYQGQIVNGLRQGRGIYKHSSGNQVYQGQYMNDLKHGQGIQRKGNITYNGNFANDMCHGYGTLIAGNGDKYEGQFYEGTKQGPNCSYKWNDGSTFRGGFENDMMWEGTYIDVKDNIPRIVVKGQVQNV